MQFDFGLDAIDVGLGQSVCGVTRTDWAFPVPNPWL
jgi:hypothetical protein